MMKRVVFFYAKCINVDCFSWLCKHNFELNFINVLVFVHLLAFCFLRSVFLLNTFIFAVTLHLFRKLNFVLVFVSIYTMIEFINEHFLLLLCRQIIF